VDVEARKVVHRITGLRTPQGLGHLPALDLLLVANGGDGSLRLFSGTQYVEAGRLDVGEGAANIRLAQAIYRVMAGYRSRVIAMIDPARRRTLFDVPLQAHPESFQHDAGSHRIFVNLPAAKAIAVIDPVTHKAARWTMPAGGNFPMALRPAAGHVVVVFREP